MNNLLIALCLLALVAVPALGDVDDCYFGITQDGEADPEEDWAGNRFENEQDQGSRGASCRGAYAMCFKIRYAGEDDVFVSLYGCLDDRTTPTDAGSLIPEGFSVADLDLEEMPDPWNEDGDACSSKSEYDIVDVPILPFYLTQLIPDDDDYVSAEWCSCIEEPGCNGAGSLAVKMFAVVMAAALAFIL